MSKNTKTVVWGSKITAKRFAYFHIEEIDFFVDNDKTRCGRECFGKKIVHPNDVDEWDNIFVYVPDLYKEDIVPLILKLGVNEENYGLYYNWVGVDEDRIKDDLSTCMKKLASDISIHKGMNMVFLDGLKQYPNVFLNNLCKMNCNIVITEKYLYSDINIINGKIYELPLLLNPRIYINKSSKEENKYVQKNNYIREISEQISQIFTISQNFALKNADYICEAFENIVEIFKPSIVLFPPGVTHTTRICELICEDLGIKYVTTHLGVFPGTCAIDAIGEVGKSIPSIYCEKFKRLSVNPKDIDIAKKIWQNQYEKKLNRKRQPKNDITSILNSKLKKDRPIIFFAGQNDVESRMIPYTEETRKYYSPIFKLSIDAGIYLAKLCAKNNWNFIYKPHPMYIREEQIKQLPPNTIYVDYCDINDLIDISDVVVTILSTTNYDAMMRYKPVVMLGYNWSHGQGCNYEAFSDDVIEDTIKQAIEKGFTEEMQQAFLENIARLCKYYLYDDMSDRELRYGKPLPDDYEGFFELQRMLEEMK